MGKMAYFVIGVDFELGDIVHVSSVPRIFFEMNQVLHLSPYGAGGKNEPRHEQRKHDGSLPLIGVNTFVATDVADQDESRPVELARSTDEEKRSQIERLRAFQARHADERPAMLARLRTAALAGDNLFAVLMDAVCVCSLGEITTALFEVGGRYRRNV